MCNFKFSIAALRTRHGNLADRIVERSLKVFEADQQGLCEFDGDVFQVTRGSKAYTRIIASWFDMRLNAKATRYSSAV